MGTCGFQRARKQHYEVFDVLEIQQTFYDPPPLETLRKWRNEAPESFEFTVKAWMLVTHEYNAKLWRRLKRSVPGNPHDYGGFKLNERTLWAWNVTLQAAAALEARIIVVQTPPSFGYNEKNSERITRFFRTVPREGYLIAWEPRGNWWDNIEALYRTARSAGLLVAGDVLRGRLPPQGQDVLYARLHGLGGKEVNYKYKYTDDDLDKLVDIVLAGDWKEAYILFNNIYAFVDAARFKEKLDSAMNSLKA